MTEIDLSPQTVDLVLYAGDGVSIRLTVVDVNDEPVNLTGEVDAQIRVVREGPDPASATFSVDLSDSESGVVLLTLTGEQTQDLHVGSKKYKGVWDVQWTPLEGEPWTILQGKVESVADVTR